METLHISYYILPAPQDHKGASQLSTFAMSASHDYKMWCWFILLLAGVLGKVLAAHVQSWKDYQKKLAANHTLTFTEDLSEILHEDLGHWDYLKGDTAEGQCIFRSIINKVKNLALALITIICYWFFMHYLRSIYTYEHTHADIHVYCIRISILYKYIHFLSSCLDSIYHFNQCYKSVIYTLFSQFIYQAAVAWWSLNILP